MTQPLVSIVMPARDAAGTIAEAIESVCRQTLGGWELVVVDDGSRDDTAVVVRACAAGDTRIRIVGTPPCGIVQALARGCAAARAPLLARMDADDVMMPQRLALQAAFLHANPDVALCGTGVTDTGTAPGPGRIEYTEWINSLVTHDDIVREIFVECPIPHPTCMMRRDAFLAAGGYRDNGWAEDYDLVLRFHIAGHRFAKLPEPLLAWRDSPSRLSRTDPRYSPARFRACKRHYLRHSLLPPGRPFIQWGAGHVGKPWLREWGGHRPEAVIDLHPRKIGRTIHGCPVIDPGGLPPPGRTFVVIAVGAPGARAEIRNYLVNHGHRELHDFVFLA